MAKYKIDYEFDFTPTRENAQELLLDLAAIAGDWASESAAADHSQCIALADHEQAVTEAKAPLLTRIRELDNEVIKLRDRHVTVSAETQKQVEDAAQAKYDQIIKTLEWQLVEVTKERDRLIANAKGEKAAKKMSPRMAAHVQAIAIPRPGELVKIEPNPGNPTRYGGTVVRVFGQGSKFVEVTPSGHRQSVVLERKYIRRYAANERADADQGVQA